MRLPKKVRINNIPFKVIRDKKLCGARFSYKNATITIGAKNLADCEVLEHYIHEVAEISSVERGFRSSMCKQRNGSANEYVFCGGHDKFTDVMTDVGIAIADMMKLG